MTTLNYYWSSEGIRTEIGINWPDFWKCQTQISMPRNFAVLFFSYWVFICKVILYLHSIQLKIVIFKVWVFGLHVFPCTMFALDSPGRPKGGDGSPWTGVTDVVSAGNWTQVPWKVNRRDDLSSLQVLVVFPACFWAVIAIFAWPCDITRDMVMAGLG